MIPIESITDTSSGIVKMTGPCSMSHPCPGDSCPEHGQPYGPGVVVTERPATLSHSRDWDVLVDGRRAGVVAEGRSANRSGHPVVAVSSAVVEPIFLGFHHYLTDAVEALVRVSRAVHR